MTIDALKSGPVPSLYHLGYRIIRTKRNKKGEIVIHFGKPEKALEYSLKKDEMYALCQERLSELIAKEKQIKLKMKKFNPHPSLLRRIWDIICEIFGCVKKKK